MEKSKFKLREHLASFERLSYVPNDCSIQAPWEGLDCAYGINPYGFSPAVAQALVLTVQDVNDYPCYPYRELRESIVGYWQDTAKLRVDDIRLGTGSIAILSTINKMFVERGTVVLGYCPQFTDYIGDVRSLGGSYEYIKLDPARNYKFDHRELMDRIAGPCHAVYIDNPNNPSGQIIPLAELRAIIEQAGKRNKYVIVDEAYGDFMSKSNSALTLLHDFDNLLVVRSFSKGFGLAGLRLGYMACNQAVANFYDKVEIPFTINDFTCRLAALALDDRVFLERSIAAIRTAKAKVIQHCHKLKVWETSMDVPILVLQHPDPDVDLERMFYARKALTESGRSFLEMGKSAVRLRIPKQVDGLMAIIASIESAS